MKHSGKDLSYFDEESKQRFVPHVIEPSAGADRATLAFLCEAYNEDQMGGESRTVLKFHPRLAPIKAAVFPLVKKDGMPEKAEAIYRELKRHYNVFYDEKGAIGRRYRRQDEAGTPFCLTVDGQTRDDDTVTIRDRDSGQQWRVPAAGAAQTLRDLIEGHARPPVPNDPKVRWRSMARTIGSSIPAILRRGPLARPGRTAIIEASPTLGPDPLPICHHETMHQSGDDAHEPFETDVEAYARAGWPAVELWLTKLEQHLESHPLAEVKSLLDGHGLQRGGGLGARRACS